MQQYLSGSDRHSSQGRLSSPSPVQRSENEVDTPLLGRSVASSLSPVHYKRGGSLNLATSPSRHSSSSPARHGSSPARHPSRIAGLSENIQMHNSDSQLPHQLSLDEDGYLEPMSSSHNSYLTVLAG